MRLALVMIGLCACYIEPDRPLFDNLAFVTSNTMPASSIHALSDGDAFCMAAAAKGGLRGTYVAWLSTKSESAVSRLGTANGWRRVDGKPFANRAGDLIGGRIWYPLRIDEAGLDITTESTFGQPPVATGTDADGTFAGDTCGNFTGGMGFVEVGFPDAGTALWTEADTKSCTDGELHLYCFGTDANGVTAAPTEGGKLAFVSHAQFDPTSGRDAADKLCTDEADALAGIIGSFSALMASTGSHATARYRVGVTHIRPDGVSLGTDLSHLLAPINVTLDLQYVSSVNVWSGEHDKDQVPADIDTCANWSPLGTVGDVGEASRSGPDALAYSTTADCVPRRIYCIEN